MISRKVRRVTRPVSITAAAAVFASAASPAGACTVSPAVVTDLGSFSPAATRAGAVPALRSRAGLSCSSGVLMLLSGNYLRATYQSRNGLRLAGVAGTTGSVPYVLSADAGGTVVAPQNGTIDYMHNNLLNLLGLLGGSSADLPFFVRPSPGTAPVAGTYADRITITWNWYLCQGIGLLGACLLGADSGSATTIVDVTLTVAPKALVMSTATTTTWDPINGTRGPRAIPGSRQRVTVSVANPDIVATEGDVVVVVPLHERQGFAADGDGIAANTAIGFQAGGAGAPQFAYADPASTTDDVDFSADGGQSWTHVPAPGSPAAQFAVTAVRFRPRGPIPAGGAVTLTVAAATR